MFPSKFLQFPSILTHFHAANEKIQNGGRDLAISRGLVWVNFHQLRMLLIWNGCGGIIDVCFNFGAFTKPHLTYLKSVCFDLYSFEFMKTVVVNLIGWNLFSFVAIELAFTYKLYFTNMDSLFFIGTNSSCTFCNICSFLIRSAFLWNNWHKIHSNCRSQKLLKYNKYYIL